MQLLRAFVRMLVFTTPPLQPSVALFCHSKPMECQYYQYEMIFVIASFEAKEM